MPSPGRKRESAALRQQQKQERQQRTDLASKHRGQEIVKAANIHEKRKIWKSGVSKSKVI
jgi:hypothetical protein